MVRHLLALASVMGLLLSLALPRAAQGLTYTVTQNLTSGAGSLEHAVGLANANPGPDTIVFDIFDPAQRAKVISLTGLVITEEVLIDGYTQAGAVQNTNDASQPFNGILKIEVSGDGLAGTDPLIQVLGANTEIRGLALVGAEGSSAIVLGGSGGHSVTGSFVGLLVNGTWDVTQRNMFEGIRVDSSQNTIGGTSPALRNVIAGNETRQIYIRSNSNVVRGNLIGLLPNGGDFIYAFPTQTGILVEGNDNILGGAVGGGRNIVSNQSYGIYLDGDANIVRRNRIGTDVTGTLPRGNLLAGVVAWRGSGNVVGGRVNGGDNIICDSGVGIDDFANGTIIRRNDIGLGVGGVALGNETFGIRLANPGSGSQIGGSLNNDGNDIANNGGAGIVNSRPFGGTTILHNRIYANDIGFDADETGMGIDAGSPGIQPNDVPDLDGWQNYPILTDIDNSSGTSLEVTGTLDSVGNSPYVVEFFGSPSCDPTGHGEGELYLASISTSAAAFQVSLPTLPVGYQVTATATDASGNTSEFSQCLEVPVPFVVRNTNAFGPDSLFEMIVMANSNPGPDTIQFRIPGPGPHVIEPLQLLVTESLYLDGYSQPGAQPNASANNQPNNAQIMIQVLLDEDKGQTPYFTLQGSGSTIRGISFTRGSSGDPLVICGGTGGHTIEGCWIGVDAFGNNTMVAQTGIEIPAGSDNNTIGGSAAAENVIAGASDQNILVASGGNLIRNNLIGVLPDGVTAAGLTQSGIVLLGSGASNNTVGGSQSLGRNLVSGHAGDGIVILGGADNAIDGNFVGTTISSSVALPNGGAGIRIQSNGENWVGKSFATMSSFNGGAGVQIDAPTSGVPCGVITGLSSRENGGLGIDLGGDGVTLNDPGDPWIDYPVLHWVTTDFVTTTVSGEVSAPAPFTDIVVRFFGATPGCDPSGYGEGNSSSWTITVPGGADLVAPFMATFAGGGLGYDLVATATVGCQTSEFSPCVESLPPNTPVGTDVVVDPGSGVNLEFAQVTSQGFTAVTTTTTNPGSDLPGFEFQGTFYDIETTASFSGDVTVCLDYDDTNLTPSEELALQLFHFEAGAWVDVTSSVDTNANVICGVTSSLSPFTAALPAGPTGVEVPDTQPLATRWLGAAPNPFNPSTTMTFDVARDGTHVALAVFDLRGTRVRTLVDGRRTAGSFRIVWDGRDDAGNVLSSGVYFARFQAGEYVSTSKVVLLK